MLYVVENLLALALAALIVLSTGWFQRWLERRVITSLEDLSGGRVEIVGDPKDHSATEIIQSRIGRRF